MRNLMCVWGVFYTYMGGFFVHEKWRRGKISKNWTRHQWMCVLSFSELACHDNTFRTHMGALSPPTPIYPYIYVCAWRDACVHMYACIKTHTEKFLTNVHEQISCAFLVFWTPHNTYILLDIKYMHILPRHPKMPSRFLCWCVCACMHIYMYKNTYRNFSKNRTWINFMCVFIFLNFSECVHTIRLKIHAQSPPRTQKAVTFFCVCVRAHICPYMQLQAPAQKIFENLKLKEIFRRFWFFEKLMTQQF